MQIERYNYSDQWGEQLPHLMVDLEKMLRDGHYVLTEEVKDFENQFSEYLKVNYVNGVNCGTDALILALLALDIGPGDEVITQANTFYATVAAICWVGATPVLVDANEQSFLLETSQLDAVVTEKTRAIIPVHLYGKPTPMEAIWTFAKRHQLFIIEDAAQAHGAKIHGKRVGTLGDIGCFSFHPSKNLAAVGDAGAVVTDCDTYNKKIKALRSLGQVAPYEHVFIGLNSKMDAIQAKVLSLKLNRLDAWNQRRREIAAAYQQQLASLPLTFQATNTGEEAVYHLFQIRCEQRDKLQGYLNKHAIDAVVRYPTPIHQQPAFQQRGWRCGQFPIAEKLSRELLCLPIRPDFTDMHISYICDRIREFFQ